MKPVPSKSLPVRRRMVVRLFSFSTVLAAALTVGLAPNSSADTVGDKKKVESGIARLQTSIEHISHSLASALADLQRTKAQLPRARSELAAADATQRAADRRNEAAATALAVAQANAAKAAGVLARNARDSREVQDRLANMIRDEYQQGGVSGLSLALEADSPADFTNQMIVMDTVMRLRLETLGGLDTMRAEASAVRAHLLAVRQQVAALKVQAEAALARARAARAAAASAKVRLDRLYSAQSRDAAKVAAKRAGEISKLDAMQAESDALTRRLSARAGSGRPSAARRVSQPRSQPLFQLPSRGSGSLSRPVSAPVSSEFGMRYHPVLHRSRLHSGIDYAARCGAPVYAAAGGRVIMAGAAGGYGNQLVIAHGRDRGVSVTTTYSHLSGFVVRGGRVARGQTVAYSGTTGLSTGCHLHFETRQNGIPVNPRSWL